MTFLLRDAHSASAVLLLSVVHPSVTLMYHEHIGWTSRNVDNLVQGEHSKKLSGIEVGRSSQQKSCNTCSSETGQDRSKVTIDDAFNWCQNQ